MIDSNTPWAPSAQLDEIQRRSTLLRAIREYFFHQKVMEVETPILSACSTVDPHIQSFFTDYSCDNRVMKRFYLNTSPEFPMKRLLSAGIGDIYSLGKVFRNGESGGRHNPEFTMLEWYRPGYDHQALMDDVSRLLESVCPFREINRVSYGELFEQHYGVDPHTVSTECLLAKVAECVDGNLTNLSRNDCLDLLFSHGIEPGLGDCGQDGLSGIYVYDFPEPMAALARIVKNSKGQSVSARFELFAGGMELANGYYELADGNVLENRFKQDQLKRQQAGLPVTPYDHHLVSATKHGFPDCSGVAMGIDRLHMLLSGTSSIRQVIAFDVERA